MGKLIHINATPEFLNNPEKMKAIHEMIELADKQFVKQKRKRIMKAGDVTIDILQFENMYKSNIQAHIDYEALMAGMDQHGKDKSKSINPGKKYGSFKEFYEDRMKEYSEANYGDIILTEFGQEIYRVASNYKPGKEFKNPEDNKPTAGRFPDAHDLGLDSNTQKRFKK